MKKEELNIQQRKKNLKVGKENIKGCIGIYEEIKNNVQ